MRTRLTLLTLVALTSLSTFGQEVKKCDGMVLSSTNGKVGHLTQNEIRDFLLTFGKECRNNVEFSEWSNEILFAVLYTQTKLTLQTMEKERRLLEMEEIMEDLNSPVNDSINIKKLIPRVEEAKFKGQIKKEVLDNLHAADAKY
jgi:hypothetical protein